MTKETKDITPVKRKTWEEFQKSGLIWFVNRILHTFGWAIVYEIKDRKIVDIYPARVSFRGFNYDVEEEGYRNVSEYLKKNIDNIVDESYL